MRADRVTATGSVAFQGGGVNSTNTLTMTNSVVSDNKGTDHGGGIHLYGNSTISDSQVTNNDAWILAGGINSAGPLTLTRTTVSRQQRKRGRRRDRLRRRRRPADPRRQRRHRQHRILRRRNLQLWEHGLDHERQHRQRQRRLGGLRWHQRPGAIVISDSTLANNQASDEGGAICARASLVINTSSITGNDALFGGGIDASGSTSIYRSTLSGNTAAADGGGIRASGTVSIVESTLSGNTGFFGGAIKSYGTLTINRSTISGSNAAFGGGVPIPFNPAEATIVNSTLWNNTGSLGGGILTYGTQRVLSSTIAYNTGGLSASGGGIHAVNTGSAEIRNSILALNAAVYPNAPGTVTSGGHTPSARRPAVPVGWVATSPAWRARGSRPVRRATAARRSRCFSAAPP